jgi:hypothetical protein
MRRPLLVMLALLASCTDVPPDVPSDVVDMRVPIPDPDPRYVDIVTPDVVIQPGEEAMLCYHVETREPLAVRGLGTRQGPNGHHIGLFTSLEPQPDGTLEDCTGPEANAKLRWFILAFAPLPAGYAIDVPAGTAFVMQFHYINPTDRPILVRDVARMLRAEPAEVTTWVSTLIATDLELQIAPGALTRGWDCRIEQPRELLILNGHMHELGTRIEIGLSNGGSPMQPLYKVDPWKPEFRDTAPTTSFYADPLQLRAGSVIRTTCTWNNTTDRVVGFPAEMCTLFAYVGGSREQLQCTP